MVTSVKRVLVSALKSSPCTHTALKLGFQGQLPTFFRRHSLVNSFSALTCVPSGKVSYSKLARRQPVLADPPAALVGPCVGANVAVGGVPLTVGVSVGSGVFVGFSGFSVAVASAVGEAAPAVWVRLWG